MFVIRKPAGGALCYLCGEAVPRLYPSSAKKWPTEAAAQAEVNALRKGFGNRWAADLSVEIYPPLSLKTR